MRGCEMRDVYGFMLAMVVLAALMIGMGPVVDAVAKAGDGRVDTYSDGLKIGSVSGTKIDLLAVKTFTFAGDTTSTAPLTGANPGDSYLYMNGWSSSSADYGKVICDVSSTGVLTLTTAAATTGTAYVLVIAEP